MKVLRVSAEKRKTLMDEDEAARVLDTLNYRARRVLTTVLLEKPGKRAVSIEADFVGFTCPDVFVVGYGMDAAHAFRQLPFVGVVDYASPDPGLFDGA